MVHQRNFAPPPLPRQTLCDLMQKAYPSHKTQRELIVLVVEEYIKLWLLKREYPSRRIVAPGTILAVQHVHQRLGNDIMAPGTEKTNDSYDTEIYRNHCIDYLGFYLYREFVWDHLADPRGAVDTMRAYYGCFHNDPPPPWQQMVEVYNRGGFALRVVVNNGVILQ